MARKKNTKKNKLPIIQKKVESIKENENSFKSFFKKSKLIISAIILVLGGLASWITIKSEWFKSDKEKADEETIWQGNLKPPFVKKPQVKTDEGLDVYLAENSPNFNEINKKNLLKVSGIHVIDFHPNQDIYVEIADRVVYFPIKYLYNGVDILKTAKKDCSNANIIMGLKDNRLYISTEFKRLQNEETLGTIEFNHWTVFKENALRYPLQNDTMFEVRDKQNQIVFSIKYGTLEADFNHEGHPTQGAIIKGYFIGDTAIAIIPDTFSEYQKGQYCISKSDSNWKQKAQMLISQISSIF